MSRTHQRWTLLIVFIFAVVLAACQPSATPTPTTRPTATAVPPTAAAAGTSESASTVEATTASLSLDATLAPIVAQSPTPASAATEESTAMVTAASTEAATSMVAASTEATTVASTEAATSMVTAVSTEVVTVEVAPSEEVTSIVVVPTEAVTMMASPTEEMTMMASPTEEMTSMVAMTAEATSTAEATAQLGTIIDVAKADGNFTTLLAALDKADLTTTLEGDGPFTVFAPTDAAFKALLASTNMTAADLLSNPDLAKILEYHVVPAKVTSDDLAEYKSKDNPDLIVVPTMDGLQTLSIVVGNDGTITINGTAKVILKDVQASNGVIHVIDTVLMPPTAEATATAEATLSS